MTCVWGHEVDWLCGELVAAGTTLQLLPVFYETGTPGHCSSCWHWTAKHGGGSTVLFRGFSATETGLLVRTVNIIKHLDTWDVCISLKLNSMTRLSTGLLLILSYSWLYRKLSGSDQIQTQTLVVLLGQIGKSNINKDYSQKDLKMYRKDFLPRCVGLYSKG